MEAFNPKSKQCRSQKKQVAANKQKTKITSKLQKARKSEPRADIVPPQFLKSKLVTLSGAQSAE